MARRTECTCGSGRFPIALKDGHGIFLCYACDDCMLEKMSGYRSDIMTRYDADEPIEED